MKTFVMSYSRRDMACSLRPPSLSPSLLRSVLCRYHALSFTLFSIPTPPPHTHPLLSSLSPSLFLFLGFLLRLLRPVPFQLLPDSDEAGSGGKKDVAGEPA